MMMMMMEMKLTVPIRLLAVLFLGSLLVVEPTKPSAVKPPTDNSDEGLKKGPDAPSATAIHGSDYSDEGTTTSPYNEEDDVDDDDDDDLGVAAVTGVQRHKRSSGVKRIICYHCLHQSSNPNPDCLDPFWEHDVSVVSCKGTCVKTKWLSSEGLYKLSRTCWTERCVENSTDALVRTCCRTNHCNGAETSRLSWPATVIAGTAVLAFGRLLL